MNEEVLGKLLRGETLNGEDALEALVGLDWQTAVRAALRLLEDGEIEAAKAILRELTETSRDDILGPES